MCGINAFRVPLLDYSVRKEELWRLREGIHELALPAENKPKPWPLRPLMDRSTVPLRAFAFSSEKKAHYCHILSFCFVFSALGYIFSGIVGLLCTPTPSLNYTSPPKPSTLTSGKEFM